MTIVDNVADNTNARTVQLVQLLTELGPDIPEISRRLGQFKESVRYRYKEKILSKGFAVQAAANHERLGLKRMVLVVEFPDLYKEYAESIFAAMSELCYLVGFAKTLVGGEYVVNLSAPQEQAGQVREFFLALKGMGMFSRMDVLEFDSIRTVPMKAEFFDFDNNRWDFHWQNTAREDSRAAAAGTQSTTCKFDYVDLLIIKELQMDANKSLKEIAEKLNVNYKKLAWHHATHVAARKMLHGFTVNWMGTGWDFANDKKLQKRHSYFAVVLLVRGLNEYEMMTLRGRMNRLPFLWCEAVGGDYSAELALPTDIAVEGLQYLGDSTSAVKERTNLFMIDQPNSVSFTIPYSLYDSEKKAWIFNKEELISRFEKLILQIKVGGSLGQA